MSDELPEMMQHVRQQVEPPLTPAVEASATLQSPLPASPEHVHTVDAYFEQSAENKAVAGLFGLWTSAVLLSDLAAEHFSLPANEREDEPVEKEPEDT